MMIIEPEIYKVERKSQADLDHFLNSSTMDLGGYANDLIHSDAFSILNNKESVNFRLVKFDKDLLIKDILVEIEKAGYELPQVQDAIWFGAQYPDVQSQYPIAFLHKPWVRPETGGENVLILRSYGNKNYLHMHLFDSRWYSHVRFAVLEKGRTK